MMGVLLVSGILLAEGAWFKTIDTVVAESPHSLATSRMVTIALVFAVDCVTLLSRGYRFLHSCCQKRQSQRLWFIHGERHICGFREIIGHVIWQPAGQPLRALATRARRAKNA